MARQLNTRFTGTKGNLSFYEMNGEYFVRLKSRGGRQTQRTKARQKDFAIAASLSRKIRFILQPVIPYPKQRSMQNNLTKVLMQWQLNRIVEQNTLSAADELLNFQFTAETPLRSVFNIPFTISKTAAGILQITLPPFKPGQSIKAPEHTKQIHINIAAGRCSITQRKQPERIYKQVTIQYNNRLTAEQIIELPLKPLAEAITVAGISLSFWVDQQSSEHLASVKQKAWSPAAIVFAEAV